MRIPFTRKTLRDWAGEQVLRNAEMLVDSGRVLKAEYEEPIVRGSLLWNNRGFETSLRVLPDGTAENLCPCRDNRERFIICAHVIALGLTLVKRATDPERDSKYQEELRHAERLAQVDESAYIRRVSSTSPGAIPARLRISLQPDWQAAWTRGSLHVECAAAFRDKVVPLEEVSPDLPLSFPKAEESALFVLEDISEGPARSALDLTRADFLNLVRLHKGRQLFSADGAPLTVNDTPMVTHLQMDMDRENGELILNAHTELPFLPAGQFPVYLVNAREGWTYGADHFWPMADVLPTPYHGIYDDTIIVPRSDVIRFLRQEIPKVSETMRVASDISVDLFTVEPGTPTFGLYIKGSPAALSLTVYARYDDTDLVAGRPDPKGDFASPDPDDIMRYTVRNAGMEARALAQLGVFGIQGEHGDDLTPVVGIREVLNFFGGCMPAMRRRGWRIEVEGRAAPHLETLDFAVPIVSIEDTGSGGWFDVGFEFEGAGGASISHADVQRALRMGDSYIDRGGRTVLIDSSAIESMMDVFSDCASGESNKAGHFRMADIYSPFVKSSLDALDGIDVEATPSWRDRAGQYNRTLRVEPVEIPGELNGILRSYQKEGVEWLRFLEQNDFGGILADEMGLGKTLQALTWLSLPRLKEGPRRPALLVCPTSLVENWKEEANRFVPDVTVVLMTGADRHERWADLDAADLVVTSYAIVRRDIDRFVEHEFSAAILDEAQHIKNRSTQNAAAAKKLRADHRIVLTGTPIENTVADLWSIMDFLMPGYLGNHEAFRQHYELPISRSGPDAEIAQIKLRRKLHPFLLRRLRVDVAKDLPPKIQRVSMCPMSADQATVYTGLLKASRKRIADMVATQGFNRSRMEILATLMKLRQACCHLGLLKLPDLKARHPSAKMELFFELVDEALDGGHRILVFSQFVSMLHILRDELESRDISYCYLDGSTKERMSVVHRFNTQRDIPLFLISLKAGGTGLNLTGADMVIHFDPWWNPAVESQATDRAYRIGQKRTVYNIKLIARGTVEEKVLELQRRKQAVIDATLESDDAVMKALSWEDIQELLVL